MILTIANLEPNPGDWTGSSPYPGEPNPTNTPLGADGSYSGDEPLRYENDPQPVRGFRLVLRRAVFPGAGMSPAGNMGPSRLFRTRWGLHTVGAPPRAQNFAQTQPAPVEPFGAAWAEFLR